MTKKGIILMVWMLAALTNAAAGTYHISASAPETVTLGQQFRVVFEMNTRDGKFVPPDLSNFDILMGPSTSYSQSTEIINGKISSHISYTYTYILEPRAVGTFTIAPAKLRIKGQVIESNALKITVVKGSSPPANQGHKPAAGSSQSDITPTSSNPNLFVKVLVDKTRVYQGEAVAVTVKIYSRVNLTGLEEVDLPEFDGFLKQEIPTPDLHSLEREYINGVAYGTGVIQRYLIFPQTTGDIKIEPAKIVGLVRERVHTSSDPFFDDFFGNYRTVRKTILSNRVTIHVDPLPSGAPPGFKGAVGTFGLDASVDKTTLRANDAVTLKVKISGNGNLKLIESPKVEFPPDFETYDPKITSHINNTVHGETGYKQFEYLMIPRHPGKYRIPSVEFSYFDPSAKAYEMLKTPAFTLNVLKGDQTETGQVMAGGGQEALKYLGKDIRYIYSKPIKLKPAGYTLFGTWKFYLVYIVSLFVFLLAVIARHRYLKAKGDIQRVRNRKANKMARKRLKTAGQFLKKGNQSGFYEEVLKAVWGYLSDKLLLPLSDLTRETATEALKKKNVEQDTVEKLMRVIDQCEFARYAPEGSTGSMDKLYEEAMAVISELEEKL